ncbi:thermonuclease family protein [Acidovorax temperans]|uniref:thermonuclease family protein n=1 Tax=Acidovorax temperans TaxID=80878 RepID=UPI0030CBDAA6
MQKLQIVKRGKELLLVVQRWALQAGRTYAAYVFLLAFFLAANSAIAATLEGRVVALNDGDTVTVLDERNVQHKIRLAGIDAPEKRQDYGNKSRQYLAALVFDKNVLVEWDKHDRYGRILGKVVVNGRDANLAMVSVGMAWHYKRYEKEQSESDRKVYAEAEFQARAERRGLWQTPNAVPPWDFRRGAR